MTAMRMTRGLARLDRAANPKFPGRSFFAISRPAAPTIEAGCARRPGPAVTGIRRALRYLSPFLVIFLFRQEGGLEAVGSADRLPKRRKRKETLPEETPADLSSAFRFSPEHPRFGLDERER
jgi:hypothetical protein